MAQPTSQAIVREARGFDLAKLEFSGSMKSAPVGNPVCRSSGTRASLALLVAAVVSVFEKRLPEMFRGSAAALVGFAVVSDVALLAVGTSVGGIRQRLLLLAGVLWQAVLLRALKPAAWRDPSG